MSEAYIAPVPSANTQADSPRDAAVNAAKAPDSQTRAVPSAVELSAQLAAAKAAVAQLEAIIAMQGDPVTHADVIDDETEPPPVWTVGAVDAHERPQEQVGRWGAGAYVFRNGKRVAHALGEGPSEKNATEQAAARAERLAATETELAPILGYAPFERDMDDVQTMSVGQLLARSVDDGDHDDPLEALICSLEDDANTMRWAWRSTNSDENPGPEVRDRMLFRLQSRAQVVGELYRRFRLTGAGK